MMKDVLKRGLQQSVVTKYEFLLVHLLPAGHPNSPTLNGLWEGVLVP